MFYSLSMYENDLQSPCLFAFSRKHPSKPSSLFFTAEPPLKAQRGGACLCSNLLVSSFDPFVVAKNVQCFTDIAHALSDLCTSTRAAQSPLARQLVKPAGWSDQRPALRYKESSRLLALSTANSTRCPLLRLRPTSTRAPRALSNDAARARGKWGSTSL